LTRAPLLAREKVEPVEGFRPYLDNRVLDMIHPDVADSGGIKRCQKEPIKTPFLAEMGRRGRGIQSCR
jgi:hypothetical protein